MRLMDKQPVQPDPIGRVYTAQELERMPTDARYELIRGELCLMPNSSAEHGNKTMRLSAPIALFVEEHKMGERFAAETRFTIERNPDTVLAPMTSSLAKMFRPASRFRFIVCFGVCSYDCEYSMRSVHIEKT